MNCYGSALSKFLHKLTYKCLIVSIFVLGLYVYYKSTEWNNNVKKKDHLGKIDNITKNNIRVITMCYNNSHFGENIELLEDILQSKLQPKSGTSILFHETSCKNGIISLNARQACAVESAAKSNPNADIFLMFASPVGFAKNETKAPIIQALLSYSNVHIRNLNVWTYVEDTPLKAFINTNKIFQSKYLTSHLSDLLRYVSLFKWGGTYLDLDVVVKRILNSDANYAGAESMYFVAAGVMNFDNKGIGKRIATECVQDFQKNFDGRKWGTNGPGVITRVLQKLCETNYTSNMTRERCHGFLVLEPGCVYAVPYNNWTHFFEESHTDHVLNLTQDSAVVHVWNQLSASKPIPVAAKTAYGLLAKEYCPRVYGSCGEYF